MQPRIALYTVCVSLLLASLALPACAQDPAGTQQGLTPYSAFHGGDIDSISMVNLKLNLHIPLVSYPQRGGKLHLGYFLTYYNQTFSGNQECTPKPNIVCTEWYDIFTVPRIGPPQTMSLMIVPDFNHVNPFTILWEGDGTTHLLGQIATNQQRSLDATGYSATMSGSNPTIVTDRNGTRYTYTQGSGYRIEDTNGNLITATQDTGWNPMVWTDTLGRSIPEPYNIGPNPQLPAANTSNCPSGALPVAAAYAWNLPGLNGGTMTYTVCTVTLTLDPNIFCGSSCPAPGRGRNAIQSIVLPNGTSWKFEYDNNGEDNLTKIIFPTGGSIAYTYGDFGLCMGGVPRAPSAAPHVTSRTVDANDGTGPHTWTYSQSYGPINSHGVETPIQTTVTDPLGNVTVHTLTALGGVCTFNETEVDRYNGPAGGTAVEKVVTTYNFSQDPWLPPNDPLGVVVNVVPATITTTLDNGQTKRISKTYDMGVPMINSGAGTNVIYGNVLTEAETDYGTTSGSPGSVLRTTTTNYLALSNSAYLANNMLSLPSSVQVTGLSGTASNTTYGYDEVGLSSSGISTQHDSAPPVGLLRGNQTSIHRQLIGGSTSATANGCPAVSANGFLVTNLTFFDTGMPNTSKDPCLHMTTFAYSGTYAGAYLTSVTNAKSQAASYTYDFNSGKRTSATDPNNQTTNYTYDVMWRPASVSYPDGGSETITHQESTTPFSVTLTKAIAASQNFVTTNFFDGLGRLFKTQLHDLEGDDFTATTYDADGRVYQVYNPTRCNPATTNCGESSWGYTTTVYDALARPRSVTKQDGSVVTTAYCGSTTLVTDEVGHWRRSTTDGLGRLTEVDEPNSGSATVTACPNGSDAVWKTNYTYDTLNNLLSVTQGGSHQRTFLYDSMSWLRSSTNPETGTIPVTYTYDADGNVNSKSDARSITITYAYEPLHRLVGRTYSNGDPAVTYTYDQATCVGTPPCYNIGRRTSMSDAAGSETLSYEQMGREQAHKRITNGITGTTSYTYNLDGSLKTLTYPSGRTITYTTDNSGRPARALDVANNINYALNHGCNWGLSTDGVCHTPWGAVTYIQMGYVNATTWVKGGMDAFNNRMQPTEASMYYNGSNGIGVFLSRLQYSYADANGHNNGNVMGITNVVDGTRSQTFAYDQVNRIVTGGTVASCGANCWSLGFTYDQWANLTTATATGSATPLNLAINANNRITTAGFNYDLAGNLASDVTSSYVWNAESELVKAAGLTYVYDGDGNRVLKSNVGGMQITFKKIYWYGAGTEILEETDATGSMTNGEFSEYVYFAGKRLARRDASGNTFYYFEDALGSSRGMVEIAAGQTTPPTTLCYDADFYPYGGERVYTNTCPQNYKFQGKERDTETGNDDFGARYYSSVYGRWLSPDWSAIPAPVPYANLSNPQTLNLYAIVADNPETFADLDGHACDGPSGGSGGAPCDNHASSEQYIGNAAGYYAALVAGTVSGQSNNSSNANSNSNNAQNSGNAADQTTGQSGAAGAAAGVAEKTTMKEVDKVVEPLIESAVEKAAPEVAEKAGSAVALGARWFGAAVGAVLELTLFAPSSGVNESQMLAQANASAEHKKGARPSTEEKHEQGEARKRKDRGGEKGDKRRAPPRKRPDGWKGPWPPPSGTR
jgi:RHS repeat-associated protein